MKKLIPIAIILLVFVALVGCSFTEVEDITLYFYDGSTLIETSTLYKYKKNPFTPEKEGFDFKAWYLDKGCTKLAVFDDIKSDCSLYAGWVKKSEGSKYYHVVFCSDDGVTLKEMKVNKIEDLVFPTPPEKEGYAFVGWDPVPAELTSDLVIYATYLKEYTVEFFADAEDSEPISRQIVLDGGNAVAPQNPTKKGDKQYSYTFAGWSVSFENVKSDLKVVAKFTKLTNKYTYVFKNYDGSILLSQNADYGTKIKPPVATREGDETYVYTFIGWDLDGDSSPDTLPETLVDNFEAKAIFQQNLKSFKVNFIVDGVVVLSVQVMFGERVQYTGDTPTRESTPQYDYKFVRWDKPFEFVTEDTDVYAEFEAITRSYTFTFIDCKGTVLTETADYGTVITAPEAREKEQNDEFTFPFSHWSDFEEGMILDRDYTFEAVYTPQKRTYTYTFYVGKTIVLRVTAEYGSVIVPPDPPESNDGSKFVEWIGFKEGMILTKDISFNARYV